MSIKIDPKCPVENWGFEVIVDYQAVLNDLENLVRDQNDLKDRLITLGRAIDNSRKHLEYSSLVLLEDGSLVSRAKISTLPSYILEIDFTEASNIISLAELDKELIRRKVKSDPTPWDLSGHVQDLGSSEYLCMDSRGDLCLQGQRVSWNRMQKDAEHPLPHLPKQNNLKKVQV